MWYILKKTSILKMHKCIYSISFSLIDTLHEVVLICYPHNSKHHINNNWLSVILEEIIVIIFL